MSPSSTAAGPAPRRTASRSWSATARSRRPGAASRPALRPRRRHLRLCSGRCRRRRGRRRRATTTPSSRRINVFPGWPEPRDYQRQRHARRRSRRDPRRRPGRPATRPELRLAQGRLRARRRPRLRRRALLGAARRGDRRAVRLVGRSIALVDRPRCARRRGAGAGRAGGPGRADRRARPGPFALSGAPGTFEVAGPPGRDTRADLIDACRAATGSDASFTYVADEWLATQDVQAVDGDPALDRRGPGAGVVRLAQRAGCRGRRAELAAARRDRRRHLGLAAVRARRRRQPARPGSPPTASANCSPPGTPADAHYSSGSRGLHRLRMQSLHVLRESDQPRHPAQQLRARRAGASSCSPSAGCWSASSCPATRCCSPPVSRCRRARSRPRSPAFLVVAPLAAILGNVVGYWIGYRAGPVVFDRPNSRLFRPEYVDRSHAFFERFGSARSSLPASSRSCARWPRSWPASAGCGSRSTRSAASIGGGSSGPTASCCSGTGSATSSSSGDNKGYIDVAVIVVVVLSLCRRVHYWQGRRERRRTA